jgi:hypothetical protein
MNTVKITADPKSLFAPNIDVEGLDLANVARQVDVRLEAGIVPQVVVHLRPGAVVAELPAGVTVITGAPDSEAVEEARAAVIADLEAIDGAELEQDALNRLGGLAAGGATSTGGAFLAAVLARLR